MGEGRREGGFENLSFYHFAMLFYISHWNGQVTCIG